jgi:hypothetical protein
VLKDLTGDEGECIWKNSTQHGCSNIFRFGQCHLGGNIDDLSGKCEYYKEKCILICGGVLDEDSCNNHHSGQCFFLEREENPSEVQCVNKV